jgi:hypothetical protein
MNGHRHPGRSLTRLALRATLHCLTGCAIGEVLGMVIGTALGWSNAQTVALAIVLAFIFGYAMTAWPLLAAGLPLARALGTALAADTASIAIMEVVDNGVMLVVPGAMDAPISGLFFWIALAGSLVLAGIAAFPVNRWLLARGAGHALAHGRHGEEHGRHPGHPH